MHIKPVLFVDIDGVMAESVVWWLQLFNIANGTNHKKEDVTSYDSRECIKADLSPYFDNYEGVLPVDGAWHWIRVLEIKYRIVFATVGQGSCWVLSYRPDSEIAVIKDKSLLRGYALIDDRPLNLDGFVGERFLLSQPWNTGRGLNDTSWYEIAKYLMNK